MSFPRPAGVDRIRRCTMGLTRRDVVAACALLTGLVFGSPARTIASTAESVSPSFATSGSGTVRAPLNGTSSFADGEWIQQPYPSRMAGAMVLDPVGARLLMIGGFSGELGFLSDVWELDLSHSPSAWRRVDVVGASPAGRHGHSAIFDPVGRRVVMHGGMTRAGISSETWSLSFSGAPTWTRISATGTLPPPLHGHSAVYDSRLQRMVVVGGAKSEGFSNRVYALSFGTKLSWSTVNTYPPTTMANGFSGHVAVFDPVGNQVVMFGGETRDAYGQIVDLQTTSTLSLATSQWTANPVGYGPSARHLHCAAFDSKRRAMLVVGGRQFETGIHRYTIATKSWSVSFPPSWQSLDRDEAMAAYDPVNDRLVVTGGDSHAQALADPDAPVAVLLPLLSNSTRYVDLSMPELAWATWPGDFPSVAATIAGHTVVYDSKGDRFLAYGGQGADWAPLDGVWQRPAAESGAWSPLPVQGEAPIARAQHIAAYDPSRNSMIIHGGFETATGKPLGDAWELCLDGSPRWVRLPDCPGLPRSSHAAAFDPVTHRLVIVSGVGPDEDRLADAWVLDLQSKPTWLGAGLGVDPRIESCGAMLGSLGQMWFFGGRDKYDLELSDVIAFDPDKLRFDVPSIAPSPGLRASHSGRIVYDPDNDRVLLVGGTHYGAGQALQLKLGGSPMQWSALNLGPPRLPNVIDHDVCYDPVRRSLFVLGGTSNAALGAATPDQLEAWGTAWSSRWPLDQPIPEPAPPPSDPPLVDGAHPSLETTIDEIHLESGVFKLRLRSGAADAREYFRIEVLDVTGRRIAGPLTSFGLDLDGGRCLELPAGRAPKAGVYFVSVSRQFGPASVRKFLVLP